MNRNTPPTRREFLQSAALLGAGAAGVALVGLPASKAIARAMPSAGRTRVLRLAHLTDSHIQPERRGFEGVTACLRHVQSQKDAPELIVTGGDLIMDSFDSDEARTKLQWELWRKVLKEECSLPVEHCLGNHDIWGWNKKKSKTTGAEALWGKKWALEQLGLSAPYRSFDRAGWRIVVLDSVQPDGSGYRAGLEPEQFDWFKGLIESTPAATKIVVVSHIPIVAACAMLGDSHEKPEGVLVPAGSMFADFRRFVDLFALHPNVRACLSGHIHMVERLDMRGVTYLCDGAVCGAWWKGTKGPDDKRDWCREGYALVDLYDDGSVEREYVTYGWKAE